MNEVNSIKNAEIIKTGELLIVQGSEPQYIHYLNKGSMEILSAPEEFDGLEGDALIAKSKRVGVINEKSLISGLSLLFTEPYKKSIRALEDSQVVKYPIREGGFKEISRDDPSLGINILNHLFRRLELSISDASKYTKLYQNLNRINDNIAIIFKVLSEEHIPEKIYSRAENLYKTFNTHGGEIPSVFDGRFIIADHSNLVKRSYSFPGLPLESLVDMKQCNFIKKILKLDPKLIHAVTKTDASISTHMFETLSENLLSILDRIEAVYNEIDEEISILFGDESSWSIALVDKGVFNQWQNSGKVAPDFIKNFLSMAVKIHSYYEEISGGKLSDTYPGFKKIHQFYISMRDEIKKEPARPSGKSTKIDKNYANSAQQIFEFAFIDKEFQKNTLKLINDFKNMKNPFNTEPEGRKIRRAISRQYWDLYKQVFLRSKKETNVPLPVRAMINFGYLDETLMEEHQISEIHELLTKREEISKIPIYFEEEFLTKIFKGEETPSINEMGQSYEVHRRDEDSRRRGKDKADKAEGDDENINKIVYEISQRISRTVAVCSGSTATAFPILTSMTVRGNLANIYTSKKKVESLMRTLKEIDFSAFYRETVFKLGDKREIIQNEVIPNFILLPSLGTKTMLWQELDGTNRRTRGRIVIPILFIGDLLRSLAHTFACFRYELNRTIKGAMWRDPVDGGLTGIYLDYVQFYKKNPKLSIEAKEKITERFKSLRDDRNKFADDYIMWVLFEKDGIPKLNSVVRDIFYKNIPFKKEIRDKLENMPAFSEIANRFRNVNKRTLLGYNRRFKKYQDENGNLPEALQKFMNFLNI
jgi:CRP-like cAMP-binding protein